MIPFLAPLLLKMSPVGAFLKRIPRGVWIALAVVAVIALGAFLHGRAVKHAYQAAYSAGVASEAARIEKKAKELADKATAIAQAVKDRNNETNRRIAGTADTVRLQGPGKAACLNPPTTSSRRPQPASGQANVAVDPVPSSERIDLIALPFAGTVAFAEQCDLNLAEVKSWRENYRLQVEAWEKANR